MERNKRHKIYLTILTLILGLAVAAFARSFIASGASNKQNLNHYQDSIVKLEALQAQNQRLIEQNELLEDKKDLLLSNLEGQETYDKVLKEREDYALLAGLTEVEGRGIKVILEDRPDYDANLHPDEAIVHDTTVLYVIDILKAYGARAIAFNGTRLTAVPQIGCIGPTILCYDNRQMPPYIIEAIGPSDKMAQGIASDAYLKHITKPEIGVRMNFYVESNISLPSFSRSGDYRSLIDLLEVE